MSTSHYTDRAWTLKCFVFTFFANKKKKERNGDHYLYKGKRFVELIDVDGGLYTRAEIRVDAYTPAPSCVVFLI